MKLCHQYFDIILKKTQSEIGKILIATKDDIFIGFICYYEKYEENIIEEDDSNNYILVSDICILKEFRKIGAAAHLFNAMFYDLETQNLKAEFVFVPWQIMTYQSKLTRSMALNRMKSPLKRWYNISNIDIIQNL